MRFCFDIFVSKLYLYFVFKSLGTYSNFLLMIEFYVVYIYIFKFCCKQHRKLVWKCKVYYIKTFFLSFYPSHIVHCLIQDMDSKILAKERKEMGRSTLPSVHTTTPTHKCTHIEFDIKFGLYLHQCTKTRCPGRNLVFYSCNVMFYTICYNVLTK